VNTPIGSVFLSYASEDSEAAQRIANALKSAGIEVWFDQSELRGGDEWDAAIRQQINACALFMPIISANAHARTEGYFRFEWKLAIDRSHRIAPGQPFLLPVVIDDTRNSDERIPERFRDLQWSRLIGGEPPAAFIGRVTTLLDGEAPADCAGKPALSIKNVSQPRTHKGARWTAVGLVILLVVATTGWLTWHQADLHTPLAAAPDAEKSIAVLPFADMSERHNQEYFSDGLSEELIDRLSQSDQLRVIARTSSFYFKDKPATVPEIARTLNVSHVLEGSVRKNGDMVRITAQLVRSSDGSHVWSRTYDRKLVDILQVQDEIAGTVALALKAALAGTSPAQQSEAASQAYNLILEGDFFFRRHEMGDPQHATDLYRQAMQVDPKNARARIAFAEAILHLAAHDLVPADTAARQAMEAAQEALSINPSFAPAHRLIAKIERDVNWNWARALAELERARSLPSSVSDRRDVMLAIEYIGALKSGVYSKRYEGLLRDDLAANPLSGGAMNQLATVLTADNRLQEALSLISRSLQLSPNAMSGKAELGLQLMYLKRFEDALSVAKSEQSDFWRFRALACIHWAMGQHAESDRDLAEFAKHSDSYFMANVHAFRGERDEAFKWLERAYQQHSAFLPELNIDPMLKSLRGDPRFRDLQVKLRLTD
jgi:TolB-like protein